MNEIKCPHCGEVFKVDASGYADIVKQVRDAEFSRDLDERVKAVQREGEQATWPKMSSIETHARVGKTIQHCLELLNYQQAPEQKAAEFIAV